MTTAVALFNNKGGVGTTTLTYHLAHMVSRLGWRVLAVDLDPQAKNESEEDAISSDPDVVSGFDQSADADEVG